MVPFLRWRLVALFIVLALGASALLVHGMQRAFRGGWQDYGRVLLADYADRLVASLGDPPDPARAQALSERLPLVIRIQPPPGQGPARWYPPEAAPPRGRDAAELDDERADPDAGEAAPRARHDRMRHRGPPLGVTRELADGSRVRIGLAEHWRRERLPPIGLGVLAALLGLTALAYGLVRRWLRPLDEIRAAAVRYGAGDFSRPIAAGRRDELGVLADQIDTMASQLRRRVEDQRLLLLAISHELRSPLTRARVNAELLPEDAASRPARDALLRDLGVMRDLISDLLESERLAQGSAALQRVPTDLAALVRAAVADAQEQAARQGGAPPPVVLTLAEDLPPAAVDPARLRLVVRNLLDNAWRHGRGLRPPEVRLARASEAMSAAAVTLCVRDHGAGVDPDELARLSQAFHRPDAARERRKGGVGLGLFLCRRVAEAHGGTLHLRLADPGFEACVTLPLQTAGASD